jgi:hypothetical protein
MLAYTMFMWGVAFVIMSIILTCETLDRWKGYRYYRRIAFWASLALFSWSLTVLLIYKWTILYVVPIIYTTPQ